MRFMWIAPLTKVAFVPAMNLVYIEQLPITEVHVFYHRRIQNIDDHLPKLVDIGQVSIIYLKNISDFL